MSVVAASQFRLARARQCLEQACAEGDWEAVKRWDNALADALNGLFDDGDYDARSLVTQLEAVLATYAKIVLELPAETSRQLKGGRLVE